MKKLYTKYLDEETGITGKISKEKLYIKNSSNDKEFIFRNSKPETVIKVCKSFLRFAKLAKQDEN